MFWLFYLRIPKQWTFSVYVVKDRFKADRYLLEPSMDLELRFDFLKFTKKNDHFGHLDSFLVPFVNFQKDHSFNFWQFLQLESSLLKVIFLHRRYQRWLFHLVYTYQDISSLEFEILAIYMLRGKSATFGHITLFDTQKHLKNGDFCPSRKFVFSRIILGICWLLSSRWFSTRI